MDPSLITQSVATKMNAIVSGQTSVKSPEKDAFENHLPQDVHIVSCHSLHGPTVSPIGQPLVCNPPLFMTIDNDFLGHNPT